MFPFASPLRRSPELRRRLALVLASAENQIVQANVEEAVRFLKATERELPFEDALGIYFRLVGVSPRLRHAITIDALSRLGEEPQVNELLEDVPKGLPGGVLALARRLQGRRHESLRRTVEEAMARARARVRRSYLDGATRAVEALREIVPPTEAVQYFIDSLQVGQGWADLVFHEVVGMEWAEAPREAEDPIEEGEESDEVGRGSDDPDT